MFPQQGDLRDINTSKVKMRCDQLIAVTFGAMDLQQDNLTIPHLKYVPESPSSME